MNEFQIKFRLEYATLSAMKLLCELGFDYEDPLVNDGFFLAGGAIASLHLDEKVNDYDFYFVTAYDAECFKTRMQQRTEPLPRHIQLVCASDFAYTFHYEGNLIQFITMFFGKPDVVIDGFDFLHTQAYLYKSRMVYAPGALDAIQNRRLVYMGNSWPFISLKRVIKFVGRGWRIDTQNLLKLTFDLNALSNLDRPEVLRAELGNVERERFDEFFDEWGDKNVGKYYDDFIGELDEMSDRYNQPPPVVFGGRSRYSPAIGGVEEPWYINPR